MKKFKIMDSKWTESYIVKAKNRYEIRHWIINHLDLSKEWGVKECG